MDNFLHRLKLYSMGLAGRIVFLIAILFGAAFLFPVSPLLAVLFLAVTAFVCWRFLRWVKVQDSYYADTEGRVRCRRCQKIAYNDGETAHGAAESASMRGTYLRAYFEQRCGNWHLTSQAPH